MEQKFSSGIRGRRMGVKTIKSVGNQLRLEVSEFTSRNGYMISIWKGETFLGTLGICDDNILMLGEIIRERLKVQEI